MKRYINIFAVLLMLFGATSCEDYLDKMPDDQLTLEGVFGDRSRTEEWLMGVYSAVPNPQWGYWQGEGWALLGDDMHFTTAWASSGGWLEPASYCQGNWNPSSYWAANYWDNLPKKIRSALIFIENAKPNSTQNYSAEYCENMKNEARFLIAYYYWLMVEAYGPIPFSPTITETGASTDELMITQTPVDEVIDWCDKELKDLSTKLPAVYSNINDWGRATSIMCLAIRARMLLFAASPLLNGNPDYKDFLNKDGKPLFSQSYDAAKWKRAADANKELIDAAEAAGHHLYYEYNDDGSIDPFMSYYNMYIKNVSEGNPEILFGRPNLDFDTGWRLWPTWMAHHLPRGIGGNGGMSVTQDLVDAFFMKNGLPIDDPASGYTEKGFSTTNEVRNTKWKGGEGIRRVKGQVTAAGTYNMYCNREARFYASVIYNECWLGVGNRNADFFYRGKDGGPSYDSPQGGYNVRKGVNLDSNPAEWKFVYTPGILHRLPEFYLGYAEALNEIDPGNPDIFKYVDLVRERAGLPGLDRTLSQEKVREAILHERYVEFNCEGIRFHDIRRWKMGEERLNKDLYGMNYNGTRKSDDVNNPAAYYKRTKYGKRIFTKKMYFMPVPQAQMDINPNLVQMKYY